MPLQQVVLWARRAAAKVSVLALFAQSMTPAVAAAEDNSAKTTTPSKHVVVIIGENRMFDHVFATYKPKKGESVDNLLSKAIINEEGTPGPNYFLSSQWSAVDTHGDQFQLSPSGRSLYSNLPAPLAGGPTAAPFSSVAAAAPLVCASINCFLRKVSCSMRRFSGSSQ
jgi:phospholipase C